MAGRRFLAGAGALVVALGLAASLAGCTGKQAEVAFVPDASGVNDKSFNQATWEGIWLYANVNNKTCNYYQPSRQDENAYLSAIDKAVKSGGQIVVASGDLLADAVGTAQTKYPSVRFVLMDTQPTGGAAQNTAAITFAEEQAGYLAGYAAVADGYRKLGFLGGTPVPGVVRYGLGFVQGANAAAEELGISVDMNYTYVDSFVPNSEAQTTAAAWYADGTEIIFACGGGMNESVFDAAEAAKGKTIGVDRDQSADSPTVVTSATKSLGAAAGRMLERYYSKDFPGGRTVVMGARESAVGLAMDNARFNTFNADDYQTQLTKLVTGEVVVARDDALGTTGGQPSVSPLDMPGPVARVKIDYQYK